MKPEEADALLKRIKEHADALKEHCDAVQILCSVVDDDGKTTIFRQGNGNHYARHGMAREYLQSDHARTFWDEKPSDPPDEDSWKKG